MATTITYPAAGNALTHNLAMSAQVVDFSDEHTATADGVTELTRLADFAPRFFRLHMGTDGGVMLPLDVTLNGVSAWDFNNLNQKVTDVHNRADNATLMFNVRYMPDSMWTGTQTASFGVLTPRGWFIDSTYAAFATYMANLVRYYNKNAVGFVNGPPTPSTPPAGAGPIQYWELLNECDWAGEEPRNFVNTLPAPNAPTLTKTTGGSLTAATYTYQLAGLDGFDAHTIAGATASVTLDATDISNNLKSVTLTWAATKNLNKEPMAYRVYGRGGSPTEMLVIGRDHAECFNWVDTGSITPGAAAPPGSSTIGAEGSVSPYEYLKIWEAVVPAMKAVDSTIKVGGPANSNIVSLTSGRSAVNPKIKTTAPAQTTYRDSRDYLRILAEDAVNRPDFYTVHQYGPFGASTDAGYMSDPDAMVTNFNSAIWPYTGSTPVHLTETNVDPAPDAGTRCETAFGAAWLGKLLAVFGNAGSNWQNLYGVQYYLVGGQAGFGLMGDGTGAHTPPGADGRPFMAYWVARYFANLFPAGSKILAQSGAPPAGCHVFAVQSAASPTKVKVLVVNAIIPTTAQTVTVVLGGSTSLATRVRIIDSGINTTTGLRDGPATTSLGPVTSVDVAFAGLGAAFVEFDTPTTNPSGRVLGQPGMRPVFF